MKNESRAKNTISDISGDAPSLLEAVPSGAAKPKLALLFLTRGDLNHSAIWEEYTCGFENDVSLFLHAKNSDAVHSPFLGKARRIPSIETAWGHISLVRATLLLLEAAMEQSDATHFALISESCVPIKPFSEVLHQLSVDGRSRILWIDRDSMLKSHHARCFNAVDIESKSWLHQHQWMILNREAAQICTEDDITERFDACFAPDEHYFITTLGLKGYDLVAGVNNVQSTWVDWKSSRPTLWTQVGVSDIRELQECPAFFARKFHPDSNIGEYQLHIHPRFRSAPSNGIPAGLSKLKEPPPEDSISPRDREEMVGVLTDFLASDLCDIWLVDPHVHLDQDWNEFQSKFAGCQADLLATEVRTRSEDPQWHRWSSLINIKGHARCGVEVAALLPLSRLSRRAVEAIFRGMEEGWTGHPEVLIPTLVSDAGLKIEDVGGDGSFTPEGREGRWYDRRTWHWCGPVEYVSGMLHFPVPVQTVPFATGRLAAPCGTSESPPRLLYVSPVGRAAKSLLPETLRRFQSAGADILLLHYDDSDLTFPADARIIRERGNKWQLAFHHLDPSLLDDYDYVFFWDDDLDTTGFDPLRFVRLMMRNRLDMAQPAIRSPFPLSHKITKFRPCPTPLKTADGDIYPIVGRLTNFVEIMAPVYTRKGWRELHPYIDPASWSGWGLDYVSVGRQGIVDALPVVHTRAVQSGNASSMRDLQSFVESQGLMIHPAVEMGWLFE